LDSDDDCSNICVCVDGINRPNLGNSATLLQTTMIVMAALGPFVYLTRSGYTANGRVTQLLRSLRAFTMRTICIHDLDQRGALAFDLKDIIAKLGPKASRSFWNVSAIEDGLDVIGESAAELEELSLSGERINGRRFAKLVEGVRQVIWGKFTGYEYPASHNPWIVIIGYDSTWFEVRSPDEAALSRLESAFRDVRLVP
jgi:hypothetical protein